MFSINRTKIMDNYGEEISNKKIKSLVMLTEQIFDGDFCACFCTKYDSANLSSGAACYMHFITILQIFFSTYAQVVLCAVPISHNTLEGY